MLNRDHPDAERLSAFAAHETDATGDASLTAHVTSCERCTELVRELGMVRAALAELPDVAPSRPLRLVPPVDAAGGEDRLGGWARRLFAPALTAGAALALVGLVGTALPSLAGIAGSGQAGSGEAASAERELSQPDTLAGAAARDETATEAAPEIAAQEADDGADASEMAPEEDRGRDTRLAEDRSPWPMLLFTGVALMIGVALLRWIVVPGAG